MEHQFLSVFLGTDKANALMVVPLIAYFTLEHVILPIVWSAAYAKESALCIK